MIAAVSAATDFDVVLINVTVSVLMLAYFCQLAPG